MAAWRHPAYPHRRWFWAAGALVLAAITAADQQWPSAGLWLFAGLSLSLGMGHGALDAALLLLQFAPARRSAAYAALYLALVIAAGFVLSLSISFALLALLAMSLWHFGELYRPSLAARLVVGGAGVMAPMLLSHSALKALVEPALAGDPFVAWQVWHAMAMLWAFGAAVWAIWVAYQWLVQPAPTQVNGALHRQALAEVAGLLLLNALVSPLMAFALYFGLWHSISHMARVGRAVAHHAKHYQLGPKQWAVLLALAGVVTALLLLALWQYLPALKQANSTQTSIVQWLVVALGAVTLPHMLLVGYSHRWLGR